MKSGLDSKTFNKLSVIANGIMNPSVRDWKSKGGAVVAYMCSFVPEELFVAAGMVGFRIRGNGSKDAERASEYFTSCTCSFVRHCFNQILLGEYDFLDGAVIGTGCDTNRMIFDNWNHSPTKRPFSYQLIYPHTASAESAAYFRYQLADMKMAIEKHFAAQITDEKLRDAISLCNETRTLQQQLYAMRYTDNPPITGSETVAVIVAGSSMPKAEYNADLKTLLLELRNAPVKNNKYLARLMMVGSGHDNPSLCEIAEDLGAIVVSDFTCFGGKVIFGQVATNGSDPLQALADYQLLVRPFCPKVLGSHPYIKKAVFDMLAASRADGIVGQSFSCCDTWGGELYTLAAELRDAGMPYLKLEREYVPDSKGQLQTRLQALIETITGG